MGGGRGGRANSPKNLRGTLLLGSPHTTQLVIEHLHFAIPKGASDHPLIAIRPLNPANKDPREGQRRTYFGYKPNETFQVAAHGEEAVIGLCSESEISPSSPVEGFWPADGVPQHPPLPGTRSKPIQRKPFLAGGLWFPRQTANASRYFPCRCSPTNQRKPNKPPKKKEKQKERKASSLQI